MPAVAPTLLALALAATIDGDAARRHAAALAALGPHPWGSPRAQAAAAYVAAQFRAAGLADVRLEPFESHGIPGANVTGVLRGASEEWVVLGAHHDTAPGAPGAYDDGGGVGVLIEVAGELTRRPRPPRTYVFASWDGEEAWSTGKATTAGSRAWLRAPGRDLSRMVAAFDVEMCGWGGGRPTLHPIAYADPRRPGAYVVAPAWLARAALGGGGFALGDPLLAWLYQPVVRTFRVRLYGDDLSFLQAGQPAVFAADSSFTAFYPWYHQPTDTADKLDPVALGRMGAAVLAVAEALARVPRGQSAQPQWFAVAGVVVERPWLLAAGIAALVPGLLAAVSTRGRALAIGLLRAAIFAVLLWRHPVPVLWAFALPMLVPGRGLLTAAAFVPALALGALGVAAALRGFVGGLWLRPWELAFAAALTALALLPARRSAASRKRRR